MEPVTLGTVRPMRTVAVVGSPRPERRSESPRPLPRYAALHGDGVEFAGPWAEVRDRLGELETNESIRWVWWSADLDVEPFVTAGWRPRRCWDIAEVHRLLHGGWTADPGTAWAVTHGLPLSSMPTGPGDDLFDFVARADEPGSVDALVTPDGFLRADAVTGRWLDSPEHLLAWARAARSLAEDQLVRIGSHGPRALDTAHSESAAALLCVELGRDGLPIDRPAIENLIRAAAGPRPTTEAEAHDSRRRRDAAVLDLVPGAGHVDLRNPAQVRDLLATVGIVVPNTRKGVLEAFRETHPVVPALLDWRRAERIATTYGYAWLDDHVGADDRLRGHWTACDGAAGRMTAQNGLHNLPATLRPAVAAGAGHVFVRADLGQIEPRVLAAVSGDPAFIAATQSDDLYSPVAQRLGVDRATAKVAILSAMYGGRTGAAVEAKRGLERAYPAAMALLDTAYEAGVRGGSVTTWGGRVVHTASEATRAAIASAEVVPSGTDFAERGAGRGRYARNAIIQGSAAELFKAWAATVRATTADLGAEIVLCLHDELLVHVAEEHSREARDRVMTALTDAARRWVGTDAVRFVADASIIRRWSEVA